MKTRRKYSDIIQKTNSDSKIDGINLMFQYMHTDVTTIIHNKDYTRLYLPLDDAIRNKDELTLISPAYINQFSILLNIIRCKINEINQVFNGILPIEVNIVSLIKKEN